MHFSAGRQRIYAYTSFVSNEKGIYFIILRLGHLTVVTRTEILYILGRVLRSGIIDCNYIVKARSKLVLFCLSNKMTHLKFPHLSFSFINSKCRRKSKVKALELLRSAVFYNLILRKKTPKKRTD